MWTLKLSFLLTYGLLQFCPSYSMQQRRIIYDVEQEKVLSLHAAALKGNLEDVRLLIKGGADFKEACNGMTVLHFAVRGGNAYIVELLLGRMAGDNATANGGNKNDINALDLFGNTPLILSVKSYLDFRTEEKEQYYSLSYASIIYQFLWSLMRLGDMLK